MTLRYAWEGATWEEAHNQLDIPEPSQALVMKLAPDILAGHMGVEKMLQMVLQLFNWPGRAHI